MNEHVKQYQIRYPRQVETVEKIVIDGLSIIQ